MTLQTALTSAGFKPARKPRWPRQKRVIAVDIDMKTGEPVGHFLSRVFPPLNRKELPVGRIWTN